MDSFSSACICSYVSDLKTYSYTQYTHSQKYSLIYSTYITFSAALHVKNVKKSGYAATSSKIDQMVVIAPDFR